MEEQQELSPLLNSSQVCALLAVGRAKLRDLVQSGQLPAIRLGYRSQRFRRGDVEALVECETAVPATAQAHSHIAGTEAV